MLALKWPCCVADSAASNCCCSCLNLDHISCTSHQLSRSRVYIWMCCTRCLLHVATDVQGVTENTVDVLYKRRAAADVDGRWSGSVDRHSRHCCKHRTHLLCSPVPNWLLSCFMFSSTPFETVMQFERLETPLDTFHKLIIMHLPTIGDERRYQAECGDAVRQKCGCACDRQVISLTRAVLIAHLLTLPSWPQLRELQVLLAS